MSRNSAAPQRLPASLLPYIGYVLAGLLCTVTAWSSRGTVFLLDMPWPQQFQLRDYVTGSLSLSTPLYILFWFTNQLLPADVIQKALIVSIVTLAGTSVFVAQKYVTTLPRLERFLLGLLYASTPYLIGRLLAGQWQVALGYAVAPLVLTALYVFLRTPSKSTASIFVGSWIFLGVCSVHWWYMVTLLMLPFLLIGLRNHVYVRAHIYAVYSCLVIGSGLVGLWYRHKISTFGAVDFEVFSTVGSGVAGAFGSVLRLQGFWYGSDVGPSYLEIVWSLVMVGVMACLLWQIRAASKIQRAAYLLLIISIVTLSLGAAYPVSKVIVLTLARFVPGFVGLRETAKIVGILGGVYVLAISLAIQKARHSNSIVATVAIRALCVLMGLYSILALTTASLRLQPYKYPADIAVASRLLQEQSVKRAIVLPWHGYLRLRFANDAFVANPSKVLFDVPVITGRTSTMPALDAVRYPDTDFDKAIKQIRFGSVPTTVLHQAGVDAIILLKTDDAESYKQPLDSSTELELIYDSVTLSLYRILKSNYSNGQAE